MESRLEQYISETKNTIRNPNSPLTPEARQAGRDFVKYYHGWSLEATKHDVWRRIPIFFMVFLFPIYLIWLYFWDKKVNDLYAKLHEAQNLYNKLQIEYEK